MEPVKNDALSNAAEANASNMIHREGPLPCSEHGHKEQDIAHYAPDQPLKGSTLLHREAALNDFDWSLVNEVEGRVPIDHDCEPLTKTAHWTGDFWTYGRECPACGRYWDGEDLGMDWPFAEDAGKITAEDWKAAGFTVV